MTLGFVLNDAVLDFSWKGKNPNITNLPASKVSALLPSRGLGGSMKHP